MYNVSQRPVYLLLLYDFCTCIVGSGEERVMCLGKAPAMYSKELLTQHKVIAARVDREGARNKVSKHNMFSPRGLRLHH